MTIDLVPSSFFTAVTGAVSKGFKPSLARSLLVSSIDKLLCSDDDEVVGGKDVDIDGGGGGAIRGGGGTKEGGGGVAGREILGGGGTSNIQSSVTESNEWLKQLCCTSETVYFKIRHLMIYTHYNRKYGTQIKS